MINGFERDSEEKMNRSEEICRKNCNIEQYGSLYTENKSMKIYTIMIMGEVEGHNSSPKNIKTTKYESIIPQLVEVEQNDNIEGLLILLNTIGGDVEAGLAMAEMIAGMSKPTVSLVLGGAHSIGIPLAVSTKRSFIVESAAMLVHPVKMEGNLVGVKETLNEINMVRDRIVDFVIKHSKITKEKFLEFMFNRREMANEVGITLKANESVVSGIIDEIGGLKECLKALRNMIK